MRLSILPLLCCLALNVQAAIRISPEQLIAEPRPAAPATMGEFTSATDGSQVLAFWVGDGGLSATPVAGDGTVPTLPTGPQITMVAEPRIADLSAVWTGSVYLVTWTSNSAPSIAVKAATFSRDGALLGDPVIVALNAVSRHGALAASGHGAFGAYLTADTNQFRGALFDNNGVVTAANVWLPAVNSMTEPVDVVRVASDGHEYGYVWRTGEYVGMSALSNPPPLRKRIDTFHFMRIALNGDPVAPAVIIDRLEQASAFDLAFGGGKYSLLATEQQLPAVNDVRPMLARYLIDAPTGTVTTLPKIAVGGFSSVTWNGHAFVAYGARPDYKAIQTIPYTGTETAPPAIIGSLSAQSVSIVSLEPVAGRMIALFQASGLHGAVLDTDATAMSRGPFLVSVAWSRHGMPAIATSRNATLAVWVSETGGEPGGGLMGRFVTSSGDPVGSTFTIADATIDEAVVTFTGTKFLAVWRERVDTLGNGHIIVRTIGADASLGPPVDLGGGWGVTAASNDALTLVAFSAGDIAGYRITPDGAPIDLQPLRIAVGYLPRVATDGTDFLVAWESGTDYWQWPSTDYVDIYGTRVTAAGAIDATPIPIATGPADQLLGAVASDGRDYLVAHYFGNVLATKRVLREGQLDSTTAVDQGTAISALDTGTYPILSSVRATGDADGFWLTYMDFVPDQSTLRLVRTDKAGHATTAVALSSIDGYSFAPASIAEGEDRSLRIVYTRVPTSGPYVGTSQVYVRLASEEIARRRAARH